MQEMIHRVKDETHLREQDLAAPHIEVYLNHDQQRERIPEEQEIERIVLGVRSVQPRGVVHMERNGDIFSIYEHLVNVFQIPDHIQDVRESNSAESTQCLIVPKDDHCRRHREGFRETQQEEIAPSDCPSPLDLRLWQPQALEEKAGAQAEPVNRQYPERHVPKRDGL